MPAGEQEQQRPSPVRSSLGEGRSGVRQAGACALSPLTAGPGLAGKLLRPVELGRQQAGEGGTTCSPGFLHTHCESRGGLGPEVSGASGGSQSSDRCEGEGVALSEEAQQKQRGGSRGWFRTSLCQLLHVDVDESVASAE